MCKFATYMICSLSVSWFNPRTRIILNNFHSFQLITLMLRCSTFEQYLASQHIKLMLSCACKTLSFANFYFFFYIPYLTKHLYLVSKNFSAKLLQCTFCDQSLYITNLCGVISHVTKVALLNNFLTES